MVRLEDGGKKKLQTSLPVGSGMSLVLSMLSVWTSLERWEGGE